MRGNQVKHGIYRCSYTESYNDAAIRGLIADSHVSQMSFAKWDTRVLCMSTHEVYFVTVAMLTNLPV